MVGYLLIHSHYTAALGLFVYAGVTDLVDGWIARKWKMESVLGTVIDPMADKALMTVVTVGLAWGGSLPGKLAYSGELFARGRKLLIRYVYSAISRADPRP